MRVRLGGKYWTLRFAANMRDYGDMVDPGKASGRLIRIGTWQAESDRLDTVIHEAIHAIRPELDESAVDSTARDISRLLWRLGYRRVQDGTIQE
jgi:hypothetical protein